MKIRLRVDFYNTIDTFYDSWQLFDMTSYFLKLPFVAFELKVTRKKKR